MSDKEGSAATARFPTTLRVESKFTTGTQITLPRREIDALLGTDRGTVGAVAALFSCGKHRTDAQWFVVDAAESFRGGGAASFRLALEDLERIERRQTWLEGVRLHVRRTWPRFLAAFRERALAGHVALLAELDSLHRTSRLAEQVAGREVLQLEHREAVRAVVTTLGEAGAGHVFQDMLAYVLALAGYRTVRVNPIGVPDIELADLALDGGREEIRLTLAREQVECLLRLTREAGEMDLTTVLLAAVERR
jgi:hypothetical protein